MLNDNYSIEKYLDYLQEEIEKIVNVEEDFYKISLLKRIQSNIKSVKLLISNEHWIEVPVLLRVGFDHASRLFQYQTNPNSINASHPKTFKALGRGPGPHYTFKVLGEDLKPLYEILNGFAHPDLMSLIITFNNNSISKETIKTVTSMGLMGLILIVSRTYEDNAKNLNNVLVNLVQEFLQYLFISLKSTMNDMDFEIYNQVFTLNPIFAKDETNVMIAEFLKIAMEDKEKAEEFMKNITI